VPHGDLALFHAFPGLAAKLPRLPLVSGPTPVARLPLDGVGAAELWVKRDERCCPDYGGNKPRKLEFALGEALARGARRLVTTGGLGTNHGLATTVLGRRAGLPTTLVLIRQPITAAVVRTLLLLSAWQAELVYGGNLPGAAWHTARVLARGAVRGERPYRVATGGSSPAGNAGFVSAALELALQVRAGACPEPAEIWVAVGTGGTLAGLLAGCALAGLRSRVVGVLVTDILPPSERSLRRAALATLRRLRRLDPSLPEVRPAAAGFELVRDQLGPGYGAETPAAREAVAAAAACGLALETTYTGKCLAAIRDRARRGTLARGPVLFWNSYNAVDAAARAPAPLDRARLPPRFRRLLEGHPEIVAPGPGW
jgi:D-cysteine desulfhydrase